MTSSLQDLQSAAVELKLEAETRASFLQGSFKLHHSSFFLGFSGALGSVPKGSSLQVCQHALYF